MTPRDGLGVEILPTDRVRVINYGDGARLVDCGVISIVEAFNRSTLTIRDADGQPRRVRPGSLAVSRRDGLPGHEGNR